MNLCHVDEHTSCFQYSDSHNSSIEIVELKAGEDTKLSSSSNQFIFVVRGTLSFSTKKVQNKKIHAEELILIPLHNPCFITAIEDLKMLVMRLNFSITFCDRLPLELFLEANGKIDPDADAGFLSSNPVLTDFVSTMQRYIADGLKCTFFFDIKIHEFLFLIRAYYDKQLVFNFFKPIYTTDFIFSSSIYKNLSQVRTVKEMASKLRYSLSGFEKKFKRVFNISPHQWMQEQRARKIYHEIHCTKKTFAEIAFDYDFSSPAHFNVFCKIFFGRPPGELRRENIERSAFLFTDEKTV